MNYVSSPRVCVIPYFYGFFIQVASCLGTVLTARGRYAHFLIRSRAVGLPFQ